ncbi:hypothetical protein AGR7B_pAt0222 [Agrobacterium deltaense RV3]|nr:hypothetical protein AGR7B_pAt0222 [Agrobacterium deltaense RV3]
MLSSQGSVGSTIAFLPLWSWHQCRSLAGATIDASYEELLYVQRRFIHPGALREACARFANAKLAIRNAAIWGDARTACVLVSVKFGAWDLNLMTE